MKIESKDRCKFVRESGRRCQAPRDPASSETYVRDGESVTEPVLCTEHFAQRDDLKPIERSWVEFRDFDDRILERAEWPDATTDATTVASAHDSSAT